MKAEALSFELQGLAGVFDYNTSILWSMWPIWDEANEQTSI